MSELWTDIWTAFGTDVLEIAFPQIITVLSTTGLRQASYSVVINSDIDHAMKYACVQRYGNGLSFAMHCNLQCIARLMTQMVLQGIPTVMCLQAFFIQSAAFMKQLLIR